MPFSWLVASLFALGTAVDAARTLKKPNILLFFPDEWRYDWGGRCPHCCLLINILTVFSIPIDIIVNIVYFKNCQRTCTHDNTFAGTHNNPYYNSTTLPLRTPNFDWVYVDISGNFKSI